MDTTKGKRSFARMDHPFVVSGLGSVFFMVSPKKYDGLFVSF